MITGQAKKDASSSTNVKVNESLSEPIAEKQSEAEIRRAGEQAKALQLSIAVAGVVDRSLGARKAIPVRKSFVRNDDPEIDPPLKKLVSTGGRGATVPVMLYAALIWKSAKFPFDTKLPARKWAELLGLPDAPTKGARRVANALQTLADQKLIKLEKIHGEPSRVRLLDESGDGSEYVLPSNAYSTGGLKRDLYFKISTKLWTSGEFQQLKAPALAMLLILLSEGGHHLAQDSLFKSFSKQPQGREVWFTTENFPARYGISASMRSKGTADLEAMGLLKTSRRPVGPPGSQISFTTEKVRKIYVLQRNAVITDQETADKGMKTASKPPAQKAAPRKQRKSSLSKKQDKKS